MPVSVQTVSIKAPAQASKKGDPPNPDPWESVEKHAQQAAQRLKQKFNEKTPHFVFVVAHGFHHLKNKETREKQLNTLMATLREKLQGAILMGLSSAHGAICNDTWSDKDSKQKHFQTEVSFLSLWAIYDEGGQFSTGTLSFTPSGNSQNWSDDMVKVSSSGLPVADLDIENKTYRATGEALKGKDGLGPPKLVIIATCPGVEEAALRGIHKKLEEDYPDSASKVALLGGTAAADDIGDPPGWWIYGSQAFVQMPFGVCVAMMWPGCKVRADFHHTFHESDHCCTVHTVSEIALSKEAGSTSSREYEPLLQNDNELQTPRGCCDVEKANVSKTQQGDSREVITVLDKKGRVRPAAVWYDERSGGAITSQVVKVMEDSIGQKISFFGLISISALHILLASIPLAVGASILQISNMVALGVECNTEHTDSHNTDDEADYCLHHCILFLIAASSIGLITILNIITLSLIYCGRWDDEEFRSWRKNQNFMFGGVAFLGIINTTILKLIGSYVQVPFTKYKFPAFHDRFREAYVLRVTNIIAVLVRDVPQVVILWLQKRGGLDQNVIYLPTLVLSVFNLLFKMVIFSAQLCKPNDEDESRVLRGALHRSGLAFNVLPDTAAFPLGRVDHSGGEAFFTLAHVGFVTPEGGLKLMAEVREKDELVLMSSSQRSMAQLRPYGLPVEMGVERVLQDVKQLRGSLMVVCGGLLMNLYDPDIKVDERDDVKVHADDFVQLLRGSFGKKGGFLCYFPLGEQGRPRQVAGKVPHPFRHSNTFYSVAIFYD